MNYWIGRKIGGSTSSDYSEATNPSVLPSPTAARTNHAMAEKLRSEVDIRRLLNENDADSKQILAAMFDAEDVARVQQKMKEEADLLAMIGSNQSQPAGEGSQKERKASTGVGSSGSSSTAAASNNGHSSSSSNNNNNSSSSPQKEASMDQVEIWKQKASQLELTVTKLKTTLTTLGHQTNQERTAHSSEVEALRQQVQEWKDKAASAENTAQDLAAEAMDNMDSNRRESQSMVTAMRATMNLLKQEWQVEKDALTKDKMDLQSQLQQMKQFNVESHAKLKSTQTQLHAFEETLSAAQNSADQTLKDGIVAKLKLELDSVTIDKMSALAANQALADKLQQAEAQANDAQMALEHAQDQFRILKTNDNQVGATNLESELSSMVKNNNNLTTQVTELQESIRIAQQELDAYYIKTESLKQDLATAKEQAILVDSMRVELQQSKDQVVMLEQGLEQAKQEKSTLQEQVKTLPVVTKQVEDLVAERDSLQAQVKQGHLELEETLQQFESIKTQLKESISNLEKTAKSRETQLQEATEQIKTLQSQLEAAQSDHEKSQQTYADAQTKHSAAVEQLKALLAQQREEHKLKLSAWHQEKQRLLNQTKELQTVGTNTASELEQATTTMQTLHQDIDRLSSEQEAIIEERNILQLERNALQSQNQTLTQEMAELQSSLKSLKDSLNNAQENYASKLHEAEEKRESLQAELCKTKQLLEDADDQRRAPESIWEETKSSLEAQLEQVELEKNQVVKAQEKLQFELGMIQQSRQDTEVKRATLESALEETKVSLQGQLEQAELEKSQLVDSHLQEKQSLMKDVATLQGELDAVKEQAKQEAQEMSNTLGEEMQRLVQEREEALKMKEHALASLEATQSNVTSLQQEKEKLAQKVSTLAGSVEKQRIELEEANVSLSLLHRELEEATSEGKNLLETKKSIEGTVEAKERMTQKLGEELATVTKKAKEDELRFAEDRKSMRQQIAHLQMAVDLKVGDVEDLEANLQKSRVDLAKAQQEQSNALSANESMQCQISKLEATIKDLESKHQELKNDLSRLTSEKEEAAAAISKANKDLEAAVAKQDELLKKIRELEDTVEEKTQRLKDTQQCLEAAEADNEELEKQVELKVTAKKPFWQCG